MENLPRWSRTFERTRCSFWHHPSIRKPRKIAQVVEGRKGRQTLEDYLRKRLAKLEPDKELRWLFTLRWRAIFTTNYDSSIQRAYELNEKPLQQPISIASTSDLVSHDPRFEVPIYHLHGALFGGRSKIVITKNDYAHFRDRRHMLFELLKKEFATSNILYIGYSNQDQNWDLILEELTTEFYPKPLPPLTGFLLPAIHWTLKY